MCPEIEIPWESISSLPITQNPWYSTTVPKEIKSYQANYGLKDT